MNKTKVVAIAGTLAADPSSTSAVSATYFAKVGRNGTYLAGSGITGVTHIGTGRYQIKAITSLTDCAATGTVSGSLFVRTSTPGAPGSRSVDDDRSFSVIIVCRVASPLTNAAAVSHTTAATFGRAG